MSSLSVLIPARNERWLSRTVQDVVSHAKGDTEVIVVLDGAWPEPGYELVQHPNVQVIHLPEPIGQRAATNLAARVSEADYVMKLDAHCSVADGFDVALMDAAAELGPAVTQIPAQKNLHIYNRVCPCGRVEYQGSLSSPCVVCGTTEWTQDVVWKPRRGTTTTAWSFTPEPKFQYDGAMAERQQGDICDVMTSLGACFFMSRQRFHELGGLDESYGSWGSFGIEVALKSWLSGGRHVVNKRTWFAHFFRVGGIGFPYDISGVDQEKARQRARDIWFNDAWPGQVRPLSWLVETFWPVKEWTPEHLASIKPKQVSADPTKGIVYYSDCRLPSDIAEASRLSVERSGLPIVAVTLKPIDWSAARNVVLPLERGYLAMFKQILAGLEALDTDIVFLAEHDVVYDKSHWTFTPPRSDCYYYNLAWWKVDAETGRAVTYVSKQTSQLCANRLLLVEHYRKRVERVEREGFTRAMGFEPGSHSRKERVDDVPSDVWRSQAPNLDIRHKHNLTPSRWSREQFRSQRNCEGWQESQIEIVEVLGANQAVA